MWHDQRLLHGLAIADSLQEWLRWSEYFSATSYQGLLSRERTEVTSENSVQAKFGEWRIGPAQSGQGVPEGLALAPEYYVPTRWGKPWAGLGIGPGQSGKIGKGRGWK